MRQPFSLHLIAGFLDEASYTRPKALRGVRSGGLTATRLIQHSWRWLPLTTAWNPVSTARLLRSRLATCLGTAGEVLSWDLATIHLNDHITDQARVRQPLQYATGIIFGIPVPMRMSWKARLLEVQIKKTATRMTGQTTSWTRWRLTTTLASSLPLQGSSKFSWVSPVPE